MRLPEDSTEGPGLGPNYPLVAGAVFVVVSLALYWVRFPVYREGIVVIYVLTCVLALLLGNNGGRRVRLRPRATTEIGLGWLWLACLILCLTATVNISVYYSSVSEIGRFVLEPGAAYERVKFLGRTNQVGTGILRGSFGPLISMLAFTKYAVFGWTVLYWDRLPARLRLVCLASMAYYAVQALLIGAMVNVGTVLLSTMAILLVMGQSSITARGIRAIWSSAALAAIGLSVLSYFLGSRKAQAISFMDRLAAGADGLVYYVSHGYVGLGYALDQPFEPTWGQTILYGFSRVLAGGLPPGSYPVRTEAATGWSATQLWSTAAPWLASDITFWGVPVLLLAVGVWAGRLWKECCTTADPFALLLLGQLTVGVFFFPANNHLLQTFPNATGFAIITFSCMLSRRRARRRHRDATPPVRHNRRRAIAHS